MNSPLCFPIFSYCDVAFTMSNLVVEDQVPASSSVLTDESAYELRKEQLVNSLTTHLQKERAEFVKNSRSIAPALEWLGVCNLSFPDILRSSVDSMTNQLKSRIPNLSEDQRVSLLKDILSSPIKSPELSQLFLELFKSFPLYKKQAGPHPLLFLQSNPTLSSASIPSSLVLQLPAVYRQSFWLLLPNRFEKDIFVSLAQYDADIVNASRLNNLTLTTSSSTFLPGSLKQRRVRTEFARDLVLSIRDSRELYSKLVEILVKQFQSSRDPKWAALRCDLYTLHAEKALASSAQAATAPSALQLSLLPPDPLGSIILDIEKLVASGGGGPHIGASSQLGTSSSSVSLSSQPAPASPRTSTGTPVASSAQDLSFDAFLNHLRTSLRPRRTNIDKLKLLSSMIALSEELLNQSRKRGAGDDVIHRAAFSAPFWELYPIPNVENGVALAMELYTKVIPNPMDFRTIVEKARGHKYADMAALVHDVRLVAENCRVYNASVPANAPYIRAAEHLVTWFEREAKEVEDKLSEAAAGAQFMGKPGVVGGAASAAVHKPVPLPDDPATIFHLCFLLTDPYLTKLAVQIVLRALSVSTKSGASILLDSNAVSALAVLALGDLVSSADPRPLTGQVTAPKSVLIDHLHDILSPLPALESPKAVIEMVAQANLTSSVASQALSNVGANGAALPVQLLVLLRVIQNVVLDTLLHSPGTPVGSRTHSIQGSPPAPAVAPAAASTAAPAAASTSTLSTPASPLQHAVSPLIDLTSSFSLSVLENMRRGKSPHSRSISLLAVAFACSNPAFPSEAALNRYLSFLHFAISPEKEFPSLSSDLCLLSSISPSLLQRHLLPSALEASGASMVRSFSTSTSPLDPSETFRTLWTQVFLPSLRSSHANPVSRALGHFEAAQFLDACADRGIVRPTDSSTLTTTLLEALACLSPQESSSIPNLLKSTFDSVGVLSEHDVSNLQSTLSPTAIVWARRDMRAATSIYSKFVHSRILSSASRDATVQLVNALTSVGLSLTAFHLSASS
jgi:Bromodomain